MRKLGIIAIILLLVGACQQSGSELVITKASLTTATTDDYPQKLSEWGFFKDPIKALEPNEYLLPYQLASPLFTDYAQKKRFVYLPKDSAVQYRDEEILDFPQGTVLIKNFYYNAEQIGEQRILETRLLLLEKTGWKALSYVWDEDQRDAQREIAGASIPLELKHADGKMVRFNYSVPNEVQCKSCHEYEGKIMPIGPKARQLNNDMAYGASLENQLEHWHDLGKLQAWEGPAGSPTMVAYGDARYDLNLRARAYLDINCAHCHRREGPAKNSGLYLTYQEEDPYRLGLYKAPVAAGRGSGGKQFSIKPGDPDQSILYHRMQSLDPGVMMPELGRKLNHREGLALIEAWIRELPDES